MNETAVFLRAGRERSVLLRHPWVFSGAIARISGEPQSGAVVDVHDSRGAWLARGTWSTASQIQVRLFTWDYNEPLDADLLARRLRQAIRMRAMQPALAQQDAYRLVFAESDGLPGLIVDRYGAHYVVQLLTQGTAARAATIYAVLQETLPTLESIVERSDSDVRAKEGLPVAEGVRYGTLPPAPVTVHGWAMETPAHPVVRPRLQVDMAAGQKTGMYLDQAANRVRVAAYCGGAEVLDCFCYTGGFSVYALLAGARHVTAIDSSTAALALVQQQAALNGVADARLHLLEASVPQQLRRYREGGQQFDVIILDPPRFARSQKLLERATRGYKDINLQALHLLRPGGMLATFSCSGLVSADLFQKIVFGAATDAQREVQIMERLWQTPDHPVSLAFPESAYLKGLLCRVW